MGVIVTCLVVAVLAVARMTRLLCLDELTVGYRQWVVRKWGKDSKLTYMVHCVWCTSFWLALPVMTVSVMYPNRWVLLAFAPWAASMVAGMLNKE